MSRPKEVAAFTTESLRAVESHLATDSVSATLGVLEGEPVCETFSFADRTDMEKVASALSELLKAAEEKKRRREEEAARLKSEEEERRRHVREELAAAVWQAAESLWSLVRAGYSMEKAVIEGDWNEARRQYSTLWQQADKLKDAHQIDLAIPLKELDEKICAESGEEVIKKAGPLFKVLGDRVLKTEEFWAKWRKEVIAPSEMSPNWNHLPYFLLFSEGQFETILSSQIEDWTGVSRGLSVLRSSVAVIRQCFKVDLDGLIDAAESAGAERNSRLIAEATERIDCALVSSFKNRPFEYRDREPQAQGGHNGPLPE
jgi:hypothetical protein